jgi:hypothetical protein
MGFEKVICISVHSSDFVSKCSHLDPRSFHCKATWQVRLVRAPRRPSSWKWRSEAKCDAVSQGFTGGYNDGDTENDNLVMIMIQTEYIANSKTRFQPWVATSKPANKPARGSHLQGVEHEWPWQGRKDITCKSRL